jgi:hypothetical protein
MSLLLLFSGSGGGVGSQTITFSGLASGNAFGTPRIDETIIFSGLPSGNAFGTATVAEVGSPQTITFTGLANTNAFGTARLDESIIFTGLANTNLFGTPRLDFNIAFTGLANTNAFGSAHLDLSIIFSGLASGNAFGTARLDRSIIFTGLTSGNAFGTAVLTGGVVAPATINLTPGFKNLNLFGVLSLTQQAATLNSAIDPAIPVTQLNLLAPEYLQWLRTQIEEIKRKDEGIIFVSGSPEGVYAAKPGTIALNILGGTGTTIYIKESGLGNTGWIAK